MAIPPHVETIHEIYYTSGAPVLGVTKSLLPITFMESGDFLLNFPNRIGLKNNNDPKYWACLDDKYVTFDSFNLTNEPCLSAANSQARVQKFAGFDFLGDSDVADMPDRFFSALLNKALQYYFAEIHNDINKAGMYRNEFKEDILYLKALGRKNGNSTPYYHWVDYSRKTTSLNRAVDFRQIN
jgi:hypothetical protein